MKGPSYPRVGPREKNMDRALKHNVTVMSYLDGEVL